MEANSYRLPDEISHIGFETLTKVKTQCDNLGDLLDDVASIAGKDNLPKIERLKSKLAAIEPSVTMIGQIKSGKTTLVNAMLQRPGLLPSDVNPWTSVITSVHLNTPRKSGDPKASFKLFERDEWDRLINGGGRMGELSERAGADDELNRIHQQVQQMKLKSKERLGRKFELLLGQQHDFDEFDEELIQRYVCLGDEIEDGESQGQFADLTKSADLYVKNNAFPIPFCIRDTPGVNDTFMMREQITISAIRDSQLCVLVLSASQALASTDLGLVRLISNVNSRQLIIFVNRIDELNDAAVQLPEISKSIHETLKQHNGPENVEVIFGSAYWATAALTDTVSELPVSSAQMLLQSAEIASDNGFTYDSVNELAWQLSGVPLLYESMAQRVERGAAHRALTEIRAKARNIVSSLATSENMISLRLEGNAIEVLEPEVVDDIIKKLEDQAIASLNAELESVFSSYGKRLDQSSDRFVNRALEALLQHLEDYGESATWQYNPDGLRILLRTSHKVMGSRYQKTCENSFRDAANEITKTYKNALSVDAENFKIEPPSVPLIPPPAVIGQTIALDLQTNWWKGWWQRRKGYRAYSDAFYKLITAEIEPIISDLKMTQTDEVREVAMQKLREFLDEQRALLMDISSKSKISTQDLNDVFGISDQEIRLELIEVLMEELQIDNNIFEEGEAA